MDILTDKAKEDFRDWLFFKHKIKHKFHNEVEYRLLISYIIEWFDSVGFYVNVLRYGLSEPYKWVLVRNLCDSNLDFIYSSRQEATKQAIIKANKIYNESILNRN